MPGTGRWTESTQGTLNFLVVLRQYPNGTLSVKTPIMTASNIMLQYNEIGDMMPPLFVEVPSVPELSSGHRGLLT